MEAVLGEMRGRLPAISRIALVPLALLAVLCVAALGVFGYRLLSASGAFTVDRVEVMGGGQVSGAVERTALGIAGGQSMLDVDPDALAAALVALPRVHSATVDRAFPHTLAIHVVPERAVAIAPTGAGRVVLSATGRVLGDVGRGTIGLPVIAAAPADIPGPGGTVTSAGIREELTLAAAPQRGLRFQVIGFGQDGLTARTTNGMAVRFGDSDSVATKLKVARSVFRRAAGGVQYIDVSVPAAPVLRQDAADPLTANAPPPAAPAIVADASGGAGGTLVDAPPAQSIHTLFG
ncbi:MAG: cell division protein FtsQ/DivIB [Gaiellales bacterium]